MRGFYLLLLTFTLLPFVTLLSQADSPVGRWQTIDEDTGKAQSIIEITARGDHFEGKIVEILTGKPAALCDCSGKRKDKPILNMTIIEGLRPVSGKPGEWDGGTIFDPKKDASYKLSAWFEAGEPDVLFIRGKHWTGIYRTKEWKRE